MSEAFKKWKEQNISDLHLGSLSFEILLNSLTALAFEDGQVTPPPDVEAVLEAARANEQLHKSGHANLCFHGKGGLDGKTDMTCGLCIAIRNHDGRQ